MISIIICYHTLDYLEQLKENIRITIGITYEIIAIDNTKNQYNIFQAYNLGIEQSKFEILCFSHEDILFHTKDWGQKVLLHFSDTNVAIIGVAGTHYVPKIPGGWWVSGVSSGNLIHTVDKTTFTSKWGEAHKQKKSVQAVVVDGLWFCVRKDIMKSVRFDDMHFSGFHCYDTDICMQIKTLKYDVLIIFDIIIEHFSIGSRDMHWLKNNIVLYQKWKKYLPLSTVNLTKYQIRKAHDVSELVKLTKKFKPNISISIMVIYFYFRRFYPIIKIRRKIVKTYPEIAFDNPLLNSFKYIYIKKLQGLFYKKST